MIMDCGWGRFGGLNLTHSMLQQVLFWVLTWTMSQRGGIPLCCHCEWNGWVTSPHFLLRIKKLTGSEYRVGTQDGFLVNRETVIRTGNTLTNVGRHWPLVLAI